VGFDDCGKPRSCWLAPQSERFIAAAVRKNEITEDLEAHRLRPWVHTPRCERILKIRRQEVCACMLKIARKANALECCSRVRTLQRIECSLRGAEVGVCKRIETKRCSLRINEFD
jgi:hypothetical protein